jgi:hypothetical protein
MKKITGNHRNPSTSLVILESAGTHLPQLFLNSGGEVYQKSLESFNSQFWLQRPSQDFARINDNYI